MFNTISNNSTHTNLIKHVCGILFIVFSFFYLYFLEGEFISKAQYVFSKGLTNYSIFWGAVIITVVLRIIQIPIQNFLKLSDKFYSFTYTPSILLLAMLCDLCSIVCDKESTYWSWLLFFIMFMVLCAILKLIKYLEKTIYFNNNSKSLSSTLFTNFLILFIAMLWCGSCHNANEVNLYEQKVDRLISINDFDAALMVGRKSLNSNIRLTNLRMYALSKKGLLPEHLFDYPQYYGIDGLLCISDTDSIYYRIDVIDICSYLGLKKINYIKSSEQLFNELINIQQLSLDSLKDIEISDSINPNLLPPNNIQHNNHIKEEKRKIDDYLLCGLLLERNIDKFKTYINEVYGINVNSDSIVPITTLPKHYREALVMVYPNIDDTIMIKKYSEYLELKNQYKDSVIYSNKTRREYGNTFWWYYDNPSITNK